MTIVDERFEEYMTSRLSAYDADPVLLEMEREAGIRGFPIVGRNVGVTLEVLARTAGARRVMELGSGFGYSAYWFARAVGPYGEVHCTDGDERNVARGEDNLLSAGFGDRITYHLGDALESFASIEGEFDIVFCDIDKQGYPDAWRAACERIRVGGLYICDNTLSAGSWTILGEGPMSDAVREHNRLIEADERYASTIVPTREGVLVAVRMT
jgi:predicted O-methyltransferase YrrM